MDYLTRALSGVFLALGFVFSSHAIPVFIDNFSVSGTGDVSFVDNFDDGLVPILVESS